MSFIDTIQNIEKVEGDLRQYCEKTVIPKFVKDYKSFDMHHMYATLEMSLKLARKLSLDYNICYAIAILNEASYNTNDTNNFDTAVLLNGDVQLTNYFPEQDVDIIISACKEFEGESKELKIFSSIYSKVLADADSIGIINATQLIRKYWEKNYKEFNTNMEILTAVSKELKSEIRHIKQTKFILKVSYELSRDEINHTMSVLNSKDGILIAVLELLKYGKLLKKDDDTLKGSLVNYPKTEILISDERELMTDREEETGKLYFLSSANLDGKIITPIIPNNFLVQNGFEDNTTKRVSFYSTIDGAILSKTTDISNSKLYIFEPSSYDDITVSDVTEELKPSSSLTGEKWVLNNVTLKLVGLLNVTSKIEPPLEYSYGTNTGELSRWNYELEKPNTGSSKSTMLEDTALDIVFNEEAKVVSKRAKSEKLIYNVLSTIDPSGINLQKYKEFFASMNDTEFDKYMKEFLKDDEENFYLEILPNKNEPSLEQITNALKILKVPTDEYVYLKQDGHTDDPIRTAYKVPTGYLTIKRVQQILSKKNTYSLDINQRNMKTGYLLALHYRNIMAHSLFNFWDTLIKGNQKRRLVNPFLTIN